MEVKFKKLNERAIMPKRATQGSAAYDLYLCEDVIVSPNRNIIPLGFAMEMPHNIEAKIEARSGFSSKGIEGHEILTAYMMTPEGKQKFNRFVAVDPIRFDADVITGKIDSDYRDCVGVIVNNRSEVDFVLKAGTKIAQMTFYKVEEASFTEAEELSKTDREGGFGSTGTK